MNKVGVKVVIIYFEEDVLIKELSCKGYYCFKFFYILVLMILYKDGIYIKYLLRVKMKFYVFY